MVCRKFNSPFRKDSGLSLVEVLISIGIMGVVSLALTSVITSQLKEVKALKESLAELDLERTLIGSLANGEICKFVLSDATQSSTSVPPNRSQDKIDTTSLATQEIEIRRLPLSASATGPLLAEKNSVASPNSESLIV